jgi:hypothetical protein
MAVVSKTVLKSYFEDGKEPDENKYIDLIDTMGTTDMDHGGLTGLGDDDHTQYLLTDGTRTITGTLTSNNSSYWGNGLSAQISLVIRRPAGQYGFLEFWTGQSSPRWRWAIDNDAEGGSNTGSSFSLYHYNDSGGYLGRPIQVNRPDGKIYFNSSAGAAFQGGIVVGYNGGAISSGNITFYYGTTRVGEVGSDNAAWLKLNHITNLPIYTPRYMRVDGGLSATSSISDAGDGKVAAQQLDVYYGGTWVGQLSTSDTSWLRINQSSGKATYTPQYFYANAGLRAGAAGTPSGGSVNYISTAGLKPYKNSTTYSVYGIVMYANELTNAGWEAKSGVFNPATVDLSATFGTPAGIRAVYVRIITRSSATHPAITNYMTVGPSTTYYGCVSTYSIGSNWYNSCSGWTDCDANGDIAVRISPEGTQTSYMRIWGYAI